MIMMTSLDQKCCSSDAARFSQRKMGNRGQWNPKFTMGALKEKITGFVSVAMDTLKTPEMKICIADAFARDSRLTIIRSEERQKLAAIGGMNIEGLSVIDGVENEIPADVIHVDQDRAFSAFRDPEISDSDCSDVEEAEDSSAI